MLVLAGITCWLKGHDWHYHGAWYRFCRRCSIEQVCDNQNRWKRHYGGML